MIRYVARSAQIVVDVAILSAAFWLAFLLRYEFHLDLQLYKLAFFTWPYVVLFQYILLTLFGVPSFSWRYVGLKEMKSILFALSISTAVLAAIRLGFGWVNFPGHSRFVVIPLGVIAIDFTLAFLGVTGVRVLRRIVSEYQERVEARPTLAPAAVPTLLIGAGRAGVLVAKEMEQNPQLGNHVVGFVDDDPAKIGMSIAGHRVLGSCADLSALVEKTGAKQAIITIASASGAAMRSIIHACEQIPLSVKVIPGLHEIISGNVSLSRIREVTIDDLLGRDAVALDTKAIGEVITGRRVLITGAAGSIGSELCRQVGRFDPAEIILVDQCENGMYHIHRELVALYPQIPIFPCIVDVCDSARVDSVFAAHRPEMVFHAAAHKHVPMMEWNPGEAIKNNVFGTRKVVDASDRFGVSEFVMISTDKAVNPTSVMGTTKRCAEIYVQAVGRRSKTKFVAVRFGNVLGSAGSVIPLFKEQISRGGPVTVTHPEMRRYFMTIPEACQLVMQAGTMGESGDIFVLDMGEPVFISELAKDLIRLSGMSEADIRIEYTGLRPGEKLFEELSTAGENMMRTGHPKIFIGRIASYPVEEVEKHLEALHAISNTAEIQIVRAALARMVPEMRDPD